MIPTIKTPVVFDPSTATRELLRAMISNVTDEALDMLDEYGWPKDKPIAIEVILWPDGHIG